MHASCSSISASFRAILCRLVHSSSWPAIAGKGDHPSAERSDGGRGAGRDETLSTKAKRRVRRPLHHASRGPPPPLSQGRTTQFPFSRCAFFLRPELCQRFHETGLPKREAERRKARTERPLRAIAALPLGGFVARAAFGGRARLPALYRGSRQRPLGLRLSPVPRFMAAPTDVTPSATRAASSSQTGVGAGRAGFRTAREWSYEPHPGHRSRPHQSAVTG